MGFLAGWSWRVPLTIDGTVPALSGAVSDGIAIVGVPAGLKAVCQAAGQDLRFTTADGETLLSYAIESWEAAEPVCHVLVPTVGTGDTVIYAYGGNAAAPDTQDKAAVTAGYAGYWPLGDAASPALDWTANANHGAQSGGVTFGATGKTGPACSFDGSDDYLDCGAATLNLGNTFGLSAWIYRAGSGSSAGRDVVGKATGAGAPYASFTMQLNGSNQIAFGTGFTDNEWHTTPVTGVIPINEWHHVAATYDGAVKRLYLDGVAVTPVSVAKTIKWVATEAVWIGSWQYRVADNAWNGRIDGVAVTPAAITADQIAFIAKSFPGSTMFKFGALEQAPSGHPTMRRWGGIPGMTPGGVRIGRGW